MFVCKKNFKYAQELNKHHHDKHGKPGSYFPGDKVLMSSKYIGIKHKSFTWDQVLWTFLSIRPSRKISIQARIRSKLENSWYFSSVSIGIKDHLKVTGRWNNFVTEIWRRRRGSRKQCRKNQGSSNLCQEVKKSSFTRLLFLDLMKKLTWRRKYLKVSSRSKTSS